MTDAPPPFDFKALWRDQSTEETPPMTLEMIHARDFQTRVKNRNLVEYVAAAFVILTFGAYVVFLPTPILKVASALIIAGAIVMIWQLHGRASARTTPATDALAFHRAELVRQLDASRTAWLWYLTPFAPGTLLFMTGLALINPGGPLAYKLAMPTLCLVYGGFWLLVRGRAERRLQERIKELDALKRD